MSLLCLERFPNRWIHLVDRNRSRDKSRDRIFLSSRSRTLFDEGGKERALDENQVRRACGPTREDYTIVPGSRGPRRDFRITVGLREGWEPEGRVYDVSEAVRTARAWMRRRVGAGLPALSGMFTRAEVTYAWPRPDGSVGSDREPVAIFAGEAVHAYLGHLEDAEIEAMLNDLAVELGVALGQERLYIAFCDRTWILDSGRE
jgi:hypothetical protein